MINVSLGLSVIGWNNIMILAGSYSVWIEFAINMNLIKSYFKQFVSVWTQASYML